MRTLVLDIETAADEAAVEAALAAGPPEPITAPAHYRDPEKIRAYVADAEASWRATIRERAALSPRTGRVVCVGWGWVEPDDALGEVEAMAIAADDEPALLGHAADLLITGRAMKRAPERLVTFNGVAFDAPFLRLRMARAGLPVPALLLSQPRYRLEPHLDLRMLLTDHDARAHGRLADWCAFFRTPRRPDLSIAHGAGLQALVDAGDHDAIEWLCCADVEATADLYLACGPLLGQPARCPATPTIPDDLAAELAAAEE